jgi:hypothetical protein
VAVSAINKPSSLKIEGLSIDQFCDSGIVGAVKTSAPAAVDPCLVGTWRSDPFVIRGPEPEMELEGGENAVVSIDPDGTVDWNFEQMEPNVGQIRLGTTAVSLAIATSGQATGAASASDGAWTIKSADKSAISGQLTTGKVQKAIPGGAAAFVLLLNGEYACTASTLVYTTTDPVENRDVVITFEKQ